MLVSGCKFDGAYDLPLPGGDAESQRRLPGHRRLLRRPQRRAAHRGDGQRHRGRPGHRRRAGRLARPGDLPGAQGRQAARQRRDRRPADQPARGEVHRPGRAAGRYGDARRGSRTAPSSRSRAPAATPRSRRCWARSRCCSAAVASASSKTISVEMNKMLNGRQDQARELLTNLDTMVGALDKQKNDIIAAMDSVNRLSATLVKEKDVIGAALDSMGPALKVLNQQHRALMTMLTQLDKLGVVGTKVLNASTDNIVASLRHLQPVLTKLADAGDSLPDGLSMLASFPFPKEAGRHRPGRLRQRAVPPRPRPRQARQVAGRRAAQPDQPVRRHPGRAGLRKDSRRPLKATVCRRSSRSRATCRHRLGPVPARQPAPRRAARSRCPTSASRARLLGARVPSSSRQWPGRTPRARGRWQPMTTGVKVRLLAFVALSAVGIVYVAGSFLGLTDRLLGRELHHPRQPADLRWPVHRQRGRLPRRQGRQGHRDAASPAPA